MAKTKLPFPRLELRWRKPTKQEVADSDIDPNWACDYVLVLHKRNVGDARSNGPKGAYAARDVEYVLNTSLRGGGGPDATPMNGDKVDTPFRDGCHIQWDSVALGNLPAFAVYGKNRTPVEIRR